MNYIDLAPGERYAGILFGKDCMPDQHIIVISWHQEKVDWGTAGEWAKSIGGKRPTLRELSLLHANLFEEFKHDIQNGRYWADENLASYDDFAWAKYFYDGSEFYSDKNDKLSICAVRRVPI